MIDARRLARQIESLAAACGYQRPPESSVCAFLDAAERLIAPDPIERCDGCGVERGQHPEYGGEPCYTRDTERGPEPDRCGDWTTIPRYHAEQIAAVSSGCGECCATRDAPPSGPCDCGAVAFNNGLLTGYEIGAGLDRDAA